VEPLALKLAGGHGDNLRWLRDRVAVLVVLTVTSWSPPESVWRDR
jgi:hypothetical protein